MTLTFIDVTRAWPDLAILFAAFAVVVSMFE
jgi:hypothetical protein